MVPVLFTFYIKDVLKLNKNNSSAKRLTGRRYQRKTDASYRTVGSSHAGFRNTHSVHTSLNHKLRLARFLLHFLLRQTSGSHAVITKFIFSVNGIFMRLTKPDNILNKEYLAVGPTTSLPIRFTVLDTSPVVGISSLVCETLH